jgi:hypothetical protein
MRHQRWHLHTFFATLTTGCGEVKAKRGNRRNGTAATPQSASDGGRESFAFRMGGRGKRLLA